MISKGVLMLWHFLGIGLITGVSAFIFKRRDRRTNVSVGRKPFFVKPDRYLFLLGLITFGAMFCESCMFDWSINYYDKVILADKEYVTFGYSSFIIMMTIGRFTGDRFISRFGNTNILFLSGILMTAGFLVVISFPTVWLASFGFLLIGLGSSIVVPIVYSLAGKSSRIPAGYAIASVSMVGYAGFLSSPLVMGGLSEKFGMQTAFGFLIILSVSISILGVGLKKGWWVEPVQ
jgi:MFS family permease